MERLEERQYSRLIQLRKDQKTSGQKTKSQMPPAENRGSTAAQRCTIKASCKKITDRPS